MKATTIKSGPLVLDWEQRGQLTITRTDRPESIQLSQSEWAFLIEASRLAGWPHAPTYEPPAVNGGT